MGLVWGRIIRAREVDYSSLSVPDPPRLSVFLLLDGLLVLVNQLFMVSLQLLDEVAPSLRCHAIEVTVHPVGHLPHVVLHIHLFQQGSHRIDPSLDIKQAIELMRRLHVLDLSVSP